MASTLGGDTGGDQRQRAARGRAAVIVVALLAGVAGVGLASAPPATAGEGMTTLCDRADFGCVADTGYHGQSVWGANYGVVGHNCTSYVSFRLAQQEVAQPWRPMGDGGRWDDNGMRAVPVDDLPAVGAVAEWDGGSRYAPGGSGHVAYVEVVDANGIEITDDSHSGGTRRVRIDRGSVYWPSHFVHIHDTPPPPAPVPFLDTTQLNHRIGLELHTQLRRLSSFLKDALATV